MSKLASSSVVAIAAALLAVGSAQAAAIDRAWVSGHGTDAAGCGAPTLPCRSLQYTHDNVVAAGGEIDILDPAGYGAVAINKAISIVNDGVGTAGVQATGGSAITIAVGPTDSVYLRGLNIDGVQETAMFGVNLGGGGALTIVNCVVRHFSTYGIFLGQLGNSKIQIFNTISSDNGLDGVFLGPGGSSTAVLLLDHVIATNEQVGIGINGSSATELDVTMSNSVASDNSSEGVLAISSSPAVYLNIDSSLLSSNGVYGLDLQAGIIASLSRSVLDENGQYGVLNGVVGGGVFKSTGDNRILDNKTNDISGPRPTSESPE